MAAGRPDFVQNTYEDSLSHVAIYLGDGLIIHAEGSTRATIDSIYTDDDGSRYYGAVRTG